MRGLLVCLLTLLLLLLAVWVIRGWAVLVMLLPAVVMLMKFMGRLLLVQRIAAIS